MKTTIDLPDEVVRELKLIALQKKQKLQLTTTQCLTRALGASKSASRGGRRRRVKLPLVECRHPAAPAHELTPARVAELLLDGEVEALDEAARR